MTTENQFNKGERPPKKDPCRYRYCFKLNDVDNARFLAMLDDTGLTDKSRFIKACLFQNKLKVVKHDMAAMEYYMRLTTFRSQFRAIGVNYNQVVKHLKTTFTEKIALALLYKLEQATRELIDFQQKIVELTAEFEAKHLKKDDD